MNGKISGRTTTSVVVQTNLTPLHQKRAPTIAVDALSY